MILAHGVGTRGDLPLPLWQFAWAAAAALVISFVALGALWSQPKLVAAADGRVLGGVSAPVRVVARLAQAISFALFVLVVAGALFGVDSPDANLAPVTIYVVVWIGLAVASALFGDVWRVVSPFETIGAGVESLQRRLGRPVGQPDLASTTLGQWPAAVGIFAFLILELVHPAGDSPRILGIGLVLYTAAMVFGVWHWGRGWLRDGEGFGVLFSLFAALSPLHVHDGRLRVRAPLSGLTGVTVKTGTLAVILVTLGGTTFDGFAESEAWRDLVGRPDRWTGAFYLLVGLVVSIEVVGMLYAVGVRSVAAITATDHRDTARWFAPSLVPIVLGYAVAHYAQLLIDEVQTFTFLLSDPFGEGWNLFGTADGSIDFTVISPDVVAWIQALAIVVGHVAAVVVAHDTAVARFESRDATTSQYTMLFVMVLYSIAGLWLLLEA